MPIYDMTALLCLEYYEETCAQHAFSSRPGRAFHRSPNLKPCPRTTTGTGTGTGPRPHISGCQLTPAHMPAQHVLYVNDLSISIINMTETRTQTRERERHQLGQSQVAS